MENQDIPVYFYGQENGTNNQLAFLLAAYYYKLE